jgi:hypothetical protein
MRPKFIFGLLLSALLVLGVAFFLRQYLKSASAPSNLKISAAPPMISNAVIAVVSTTVSVPVFIQSPEQHQTAIDVEIDRLQQLSMNDDPASLSNILADLNNSEKEVRQAAVEAAKQFGSTKAIPILKAVAANTDDAQEQTTLLEAADFLSLPSVDFRKSEASESPKENN